MPKPTTTATGVSGGLGQNLPSAFGYMRLA